MHLRRRRLACLAVAAGFGFHPRRTADGDEEKDDEQRAALSLGWIAHGFLSLKARFVRLMRGRSAVRTADSQCCRCGRAPQEPRFDVRAAAGAAPQTEPETER